MQFYGLSFGLAPLFSYTERSKKFSVQTVTNVEITKKTELVFNYCV